MCYPYIFGEMSIKILFIFGGLFVFLLLNFESPFYNLDISLSYVNCKYFPHNSLIFLNTLKSHVEKKVLLKRTYEI